MTTNSSQWCCSGENTPHETFFTSPIDTEYCLGHTAQVPIWTYMGKELFLKALRLFSCFTHYKPPLVSILARNHRLSFSQGQWCVCASAGCVNVLKRPTTGSCSHSLVEASTWLVSPPADNQHKRTTGFEPLPENQRRSYCVWPWDKMTPCKTTPSLSCFIR